MPGLYQFYGCAVVRDNRITGQQNQAFEAGLGHLDAVERVVVQLRQVCDSGRVVASHGQFRVSVFEESPSEQACIDRIATDEIAASFESGQ